MVAETKVRIPAGTKVIIPVWSLHHDWRYYPNPEVFDPERFIGENKQTRPNSVFLPLGDGPRACLGKNKTYFCEFWSIKKNCRAVLQIFFALTVG